MTYPAAGSHIVTKQAADRLTADPQSPPHIDRNHTVDALRGVAAMAVVWFHVTVGNPLFNAGFLRHTGRQGWVGVEIFFVISGFILPYALARRGYHVRDFASFFARRIVRLEPPYIASLLLCVLLALLSTRLPGYHGHPIDVSARTAFLHVTYLAGIMHVSWWNPVYWTLAIELQFYILIGLFFPVLDRRHAASVFFVVAVALASAFLLPSSTLITTWLPAFAAGIITYQGHAHAISRTRYVIALALLAVGMWFLYGFMVACVITLTALAIMYLRIRSRVLLYLGGISYSLYLVHVPIGGRVINLAVRMHPGQAGAAVAVFAAALVSIAAAHVLNRVVELPSRVYASRMGARPRTLT